MKNYISWHYSQGTKNFLEIWKNYLDFFWYYFSVKRLLGTLFSPWKRDVSRVNRVGFHPGLFLESLMMNVLTRILGAIVRSCVISFGLFVELGVIFFGVVTFLVWLLCPLVLIGSFIVVVIALKQTQYVYVFFYASFFVFSLWVIFLSLRGFWNRDDENFSLELLSLSQKKWFERVWNRLGVQGTEVDKNIFSDDEALKNYLRGLDVAVEKFWEIVEWEVKNQKELLHKRKFWRRDNLMAGMPIGRNWAFAYTTHLDRYATDLSVADYSEHSDAHLVGKKDDLEEVKQILLRASQNNVILIGEAGVGRNTIIHTLARQIRTNKLHDGWLENKRILELDIKSLIASYSASGNVEFILNEIFSEAAYAGNVILVLKDLHEYLGDSFGGTDIASVISEFLSLSSFQIIGLTDQENFHAHIEKKGNIMKYCDKVQVGEMTGDDALKVMLYKLRKMERNRVVFTYSALEEIVNLADRYITSVPFPEKALDLMEEVILHWSSNSIDNFITKSVVDEAVSLKIKVPIGDMEYDESEKLLNMEKYLHERVIGQEFAIEKIAETMRRARIGMVAKNKPIGSFLFLGPTGVGKTETAKALAENYFGSEDRMIRLDMSEYQTQESIDRLLGSSINNKEGYLVSKVKENPYAMLLLDEIEKAYPDILNLFLQVLDEGHLTDAFGKRISFRNLIIIATSNAGAEIIREGIQQKLSPKEMQERVTEYVIKQGIFRPELLNRFGGVVFFAPLSQKDIFSVTTLMLESYREKLRTEQNIEINFTKDVSERIASEAYDPVFGARVIGRYIEEHIGDAIAKKIISGEIKKGDDFSFGVGDME